MLLKLVSKGKFIVWKAYIRKQEIIWINLSAQLTKLGRPWKTDRENTEILGKKI